MKISNKISYTIGQPELLENIRQAQREHHFFIPSDFVHFLINYNEIIFTEKPMVYLNNDQSEFGELYNLKLLIWELNHYRKLEKNFESKFWLKNHLSIGNTDDYRILIGINVEILNEIFMYDDEVGEILKISDNIYNFINDKLKFLP